MPLLDCPNSNDFSAFRNSPSEPKRKTYEFGRIDSESPSMIEVPMSLFISTSFRIFAMTCNVDYIFVFTAEYSVSSSKCVPFNPATSSAYESVRSLS